MAARRCFALFLPTILLPALLLALLAGCDEGRAGAAANGQPEDEEDGGLPEDDDGCPPPDGGGKGDGGEAADQGQPDAVRGGAADAGEPPSSCSVQGRVLDGEGAPLAGLRLVLCDARTCYSSDTDEQGAYRFDGVKPEPLTLKVLGEARGRISMSLPGIGCAPGQLREVEPLHLPALPETGIVVRAEGGGEVQLLPELLLTLPAGLLFPSFADEELVRAAALDLVLLPSPMREPVRPQAVFAFSPYGTEAGEPIGFAVRVGPGGGELEAFVLDHATGELHSLFAVQAGADGWLRSPPGVGLPELSWLLLAATPGAAPPSR